MGTSIPGNRFPDVLDGARRLVKLELVPTQSWSPSKTSALPCSVKTTVRAGSRSPPPSIMDASKNKDHRISRSPFRYRVSAGTTASAGKCSALLILSRELA